MTARRVWLLEDPPAAMDVPGIDEDLEEEDWDDEDEWEEDEDWEEEEDDWDDWDEEDEDDL